jgi:hypothetical protein
MDVTRVPHPVLVLNVEEHYWMDPHRAWPVQTVEQGEAPEKMASV